MLCTRCQKNKPVRGLKRCQPCREYGAAKAREYHTPEHRTKQERIAALREKGRCLNHPRRKSEVGDWCWECTEARRRYHNDYSATAVRKRRSLRLCSTCNRERAPGLKRCAVCNEANNRRCRDYRASGQASRDQRAGRLRQIQDGICVRCAKAPATKGYRMCDPCAAWVSEYQQQRNAQKKR